MGMGVATCGRRGGHVGLKKHEPLYAFGQVLNGATTVLVGESQVALGDCCEKTFPRGQQRQRPMPHTNKPHGVA